jgi:hypothetical protein
MTDFRLPSAKEPGPQPDPMLQPGRRSSGWVWLFGIAVLAIVVVTLYGINNQEPQTAANEPAAQSSTTGAAPNDQQADQQNGQQSDQDAQKPGSGQQGGPANSPNAAAPQKQQGSQTNQQPPKQ